MTTKWTATSPTGQKLSAVLEGDNVFMCSVKGNHGQVTLAVWEAKVAAMAAAGFVVEAE